MLQKFLFVGLGGSGGKTLRFLHDDLSRRLHAKQWEGDLPGGWQFVHIDVPVTADGLSPDLPAQLSRRSYVGLAPAGLTYTDLDEQLASQGGGVSEYIAPWRPRADRVGVDPSIGAGQFRAVGRAITAASLRQGIERLRHAVNALRDVAIDDEFSRAAKLLTGSGEISPLPPQVILVSSIAGGSGAGSVLDVADVMRHLADPWGGRAASILFLPDVFAEVPEAQRAGVTANALATISELMNAFWDDGTFHLGDAFPLLRANGLPPTAGPKRGPRYPLLVGRSNGDIRYATQNEVYRAAAKALASWMTDKSVQDTMATSFLGNWSNTAETRVDATRLTREPGVEVPFSAMGYASVGLGRERFAQYASERLAAHAVDRLLFAHETEDVREERMTAEEAAQKRAADVRHQFLEQCHLRERGPEDNEIIDAIRGGPGKESRRDHLERLRAQMTQDVVGQGREVDAELVRTRVMRGYRENEPQIVGEIFEDDADRARRWVDTIQEVITHQVARALGQEGARVTEWIVKDVHDELAREVVPELRREANGARAYASQNDERVNSRFAGLAGKIKANENPAVSQSIQECLDSVYAQAEARMLDLAASIVGDLADNFLAPLLKELTTSRRRLEVEYDGTPDMPSEMRTWTRGSVSSHVLPAQNEILLEDTDDYPTHFLARIRATVGASDLEGGRSAAVRQVIAGEHPSEPDAAPEAIELFGRWVPNERTLSLTQAPTHASFRIAIEGDRVLSRARHWVYEPGTAMSAFVMEPLRTYLSEDGVEPAEHRRRIERFRVGLQQALRAARPLVQLDPGRVAAVHGGVAAAEEPVADVITPFPFEEGHPARDVVREVLHDRSEDQLRAMFDEGETSTIEVTTFLAGHCQPNVIQSLVDPIKSDWSRRREMPGQAGFWDRRRARPLTEFVPVTPETLQAMVTGWHTARLLNWLDPGELNQRAASIWTSRGLAPFPFPLLGSHLRSRAELLPAVLESLPLALLDEPEEGLRAYWQLMALGSRSAQHELDDQHANGALTAWLEKGQVVEGAPVPDRALLSASPDERVDAAIAILDNYEAKYQTIAQGSWPPEEADQRLWELRRPLLIGIQRLRDDVERCRQPIVDETW